jgi:hypothetical protein
LCLSYFCDGGIPVQFLSLKHFRWSPVLEIRGRITLSHEDVGKTFWLEMLLSKSPWFYMTAFPSSICRTTFLLTPFAFLLFECIICIMYYKFFFDSSSFVQTYVYILLSTFFVLTSLIVKSCYNSFCSNLFRKLVLSTCSNSLLRQHVLTALSNSLS